jgi:hypothetical protein
MAPSPQHKDEKGPFNILYCIYSAGEPCTPEFVTEISPGLLGEDDTKKVVKKELNRIQMQIWKGNWFLFFFKCWSNGKDRFIYRIA